MQLIYKNLSRLRGFSFSIYSNQHHAVKEVIDGKEYAYDHNISRYEPVIQAFLEKRWTKKEEIPPKIYIIDSLNSIKSELDYQQLYPLERLLDQQRLQRMDQNDDLNTSYLISIFSEEYFKQLCDQYVSKILISGRVPPMNEITQYERIKQKVINLYRVFFDGDELSELEKEIEIKYLALKQRKFFKYQATQKSADKCKWTYSQQRRVELIQNWRARDLDLYDDFRPFYKPLKIDEKLPNFYTILKLNQEKLSKRLLFELFEKRRFYKSRKRTEWFISYLFVRTMLYTHSLELTRVLRIPPDFHIEHSLVNMHIWLLIDRLQQIGIQRKKKLNQIDNAEAQFAWKILDEQFRKYTAQEIGKIHLRKKNDFIKDVDSYMKVSRNYLNFHFNKNTSTMKNNYLRLDALVWSIVFFEKIPRYSEQVYLMAEYLKAQYDYVQSLPYQKFLDADVQFDVMNMSLDYKNRLLALNPPMEEKEFLEEFYSDNKKKKYYYSYEQGENFQMPLEIDGLFDHSSSLLQRRLEKFNQNLTYQYKKFQNLTTYDHFSYLEEQKTQAQIINDKYAWGVDQIKKDNIDQIKQELRQKQKEEG